MAWEITHYAAARASLSPAARLPEKLVDNVLRAQCACCRRWRQMFVLVDLRQFPAAFRSALPDGADWACSFCWERWVHLQRDTGDGRKFSEAILYEFSGAPQSFLDQVQAKMDQRVARSAASASAQGNPMSGRNRPGVRHVSELNEGGA